MKTLTYSALVRGLDAEIVPVGLVRRNNTRPADYLVVIRAACKASGFALPADGLTPVSPSVPGDRPYPLLNLACALSLLTEAGHLPADLLERCLFLGELSMTGELRPGRGTIPIVRELERHPDIKAVFVPAGNAEEAIAAAHPGLEVYAARTLVDVVDDLRGGGSVGASSYVTSAPTAGQHGVDLSDIIGQARAKRALEIAAAGGHSLLMIGSPGAGKSMLARRLATLLPEMTREEKLETSTVYSAIGAIPEGQGLIHSRPFRAPHHSISLAGIVGGGPTLSPGEASLAHNGVLFLDELPEFRRDVRDYVFLAQGEGQIDHLRDGALHTLPSRFQLVATMLPCPCGYFGDTRRRCSCSEDTRRRYAGHTEALRSRFDMIVHVPTLGREELRNAPQGEDSSTVRDRVAAVRNGPAKVRGMLSSQLEGGLLQSKAPWDMEDSKVLDLAFDLTLHDYERAKRLSRTIADLAGSETIELEHIQEAIGFLGLEE